MIKVLFVCHGNICRSPIAEYVFRDLVSRVGLVHDFVIDSAATSREEIGNSIYPPARRKLAEHGISADGHRARQITRCDYEEFDYLIGMERYNIRNMLRFWGSDPQKKIHLLLDFGKNPRDIEDPWYTGDFETAYQDILEGCEALLAHIRKTEKI